MALEGRDKLSFIDGSNVVPTAGTPQHKQWRIVDCVVRTWILSTISKDIVNAFLYVSSSRDLWMELEAQYGECDGTLLHKLQREINSTSQGNMSVTAYYTKLKQLWDEFVCLMPPALCSCGLCVCGCNKTKADQNDASQLIQFLMGLNESYDNIRSQILVLEPLPHVNKAYSMVMRVKRQRQVNSEYLDVGDNSAMKAYEQRFNVDWYKELSEQRRKQGVVGRAHAADIEQKTMEKTDPNGNHLISELLEALRLVQNKMPNDPLSVHFATEMAGMAKQKFGLANCNSCSWIVDTGATSHMCGEKRLFHSLTTLKTPKQIHLPDNHITQATQFGDVKLSPTFTLTNDLKLNRVLELGKQVRKLYFLDKDSFVSVSTQSNNIVQALYSSFELDNYSLWHQRLGHCSLDVMHRVSVLKNTKPEKHHLCSICPLAKQTRAPFPLSISDTKSSFDLIHIDIWGPYKQATLSGAHYILTIVDDHSRVTWTFLMHHKSQVVHILTSFFARILTHFGTKIKVVRTDNGSKFLSSSCQDFFQKQGVIHQKTYTYTPQQNGVVERKHRHLLQVARALMFQSQLPKHFWGDSILTATHIINKLPTPTLNWKSPFEILYDSPPTYDNLKMFGCLCFASNIYPHKSKFDQRAFKRVFLGYVPDHKGYKLYDIQRDKVLISRDVIFHESVFPFQSKSTVSDALPISVPSLNPESLITLTDSHLLLLPTLYLQLCLTTISHSSSIEFYFSHSSSSSAVERYKARLVTKGYNQVEGVDYFDRFSPVAKTVTVRIVLAVASGFNWPIHQIDINNAFLHGFLDEDIFMTAPDGYSVPVGKVCKLKRSLYGLKQASRQWNQELTSKLLQFGFFQFSHDHCLFVKDTTADLLVFIKDLGYAKYFLGLEIARSSTGTSVTQYKYIRDIIADAGLEHSKPISTPLPLGLKLTSHNLPALEDPEPFRRLVGRLLYLGYTRPDISYAAQQLSQFIHTPCQSHMDAALHLVRYLKGCPDRGLFFPAANSFTLTAYCDADWASCVDTRRSLTGYCEFLGNALIAWKTKKQTTVSRSTTEAEYRSLGATVCELQWIMFLLQDLHIAVPTPIPLFCDNQAALHIVANLVFHERTKHLEIDCHLVRDKYKFGLVLPSHIFGRQQLDLFTKLLPSPLFAEFLSKLGLVSVTQAHPEGGLLK
ncbi:UNVERIFIED_CONTAM: Retrovirus-related Pol polyprotein from transposon RE1 [Sesamum radiatum]|uniref:Retrovirus-related Pol polyprotein from transposon RE1 n=1 Tax=Sesamum radiatum TaxID=300843 RepID=A0AAW2VPK2_SESRA